jgi:hypothetical protein
MKNKTRDSATKAQNDERDALKAQTPARFGEESL